MARAPGDTRSLLELCGGYFGSYVLTGVLVKYFTDIREPRLSDMGYLVNNTLGGSLCALLVVGFAGWIRMRSNQLRKFGPFTLPSEIVYIIPSGICTAVIIPTTTLMYMLPMSVMVAMVIMRGSVIVISRLVDAIQIRQGILVKQVYAEENWAVVFALLAVATNILLIPIATSLGISIPGPDGAFDFVRSPFAMTVMGLYIGAYSVRIYVMNYFKNTRGKGVPLDNKGFFAIEQIAATGTMVIAISIFVASGSSDPRIVELDRAVRDPVPLAILAGIPYGAVAFFSVFIFMFQGRTATFAGLVNRLISLLGGVVATIALAALWGLPWPSVQDWVSVGFIGIAVAFLARAEKRRAAEHAAVKAA